MSSTAPWESHAACQGDDINLWFPEGGEDHANHGRYAKQVCAGCPVLTECLEASLERGEEHGIWGGAGGDQRRYFLRAYARRALIPEGWAGKLDRHRRRLNGEAMRVEDRNGPNATHGLRVTYNRGCRCVSCMWATSDDVTLDVDGPTVGPAELDLGPVVAAEFASAWLSMIPTAEVA